MLLLLYTRFHGESSPRGETVPGSTKDLRACSSRRHFPRSTLNARKSFGYPGTLTPLDYPMNLNVIYEDSGGLGAPLHTQLSNCFVTLTHNLTSLLCNSIISNKFSVSNSDCSQWRLFISLRLINCGIRFIFDLRRDVHITPCRRRLGWLSVNS